MAWLTILMALLSFFGAKKNGASNTKALLTAGLVGAGSYYVTHNTDWGRANLGALDGVVPVGSTPLLDTAGNPAVDADGRPVYVDGPTADGGAASSDTSMVGTVGKVLTSWGGTGTAAVLGTAAAATSGFFGSSAFKWILGGAVALLILK